MDESKVFVFVRKLLLEWTNLLFSPHWFPLDFQAEEKPHGLYPYDHGDCSSSLSPAFCSKLYLKIIQGAACC